MLRVLVAVPILLWRLKDLAGTPKASGPLSVYRCDLDMLGEFLTVVGCERVNQICYWAPHSTAELLDTAEQIGIVKQRKLADLVVLDDDPQADISAMRQVHMVIRAGQRV